MHFFFLFLLQQMLRKCKVCYSLNWFKLPMKVINRTKAVTQHFLENSFKKLSIKENKKIKIRKSQKYSLAKCLLRHDVVRVFVSFLVLVFVRAILSWCP